MKVTFTIVFNRKNALNTEGKAPIEIVAYQNRKRKYFSTKISIAPNQWNARLKLINIKHPQANELNTQIQEMIKKIEKVQSDFFVREQTFTIDNMKRELEKSQMSVSFIKFIKSEIANDKILTKSTIVSHNNLVNKLLEFSNGKDLSFSEVDYSFVDAFMNHLRGQGLAANTVHKQNKNLKKYINVAIKKGYLNSNPCKEMKIKVDKTSRSVLTLDEIKKIETLNLKIFDKRISVVRDMFLFACYTGLRISDVTNLKPKFVKKDKRGYNLDFVTLKVNKHAIIPLHSLFKMAGDKKSKPEMLLEKYYDKSSESIFPNLTEPYINRHLKVIAEEAKIPVKVTFHTARHSFGTYMSTKIPLPQLMYLMQHSDIKTTMIYVNTSQEMVEKGLMKVDWE